MSAVSPLAVVLAAALTFLLGGAWYSGIFARVWQREAAVTDSQLRSGSLRIFTGAAALAVVMALTLAAFIGDEGPAFGTFAGFAAGVGWVGCAIGTLHLFERRSLVLFAIDAGYFAVSFTAMGALIGALQ